MMYSTSSLVSDLFIVYLSCSQASFTSSVVGIGSVDSSVISMGAGEMGVLELVSDMVVLSLSTFSVDVLLFVTV